MVSATGFVTDWPVNPHMPCYTRGNAGEVLAGPVSPLGWTLGFEQGVLPGWRTGLIEFGLYRESELDPDRPPVVGMFGGYFYLNLSHLRIMSIRMGLAPDALGDAYVGSAGSAAPTYIPRPEDECADCSARVARTMAWAMTAEDFPAVNADRVRARAARASRPDLPTLSAPDLVARMRSFCPELATAFHRHVFTGLAATVGPAAIDQLVTEAGRPELLLDLISGWGDVDSAAPSTGLWELGRSAAGVDQAQLAAFLREHGSRGPSEWDIHAPSWESCPELVLAPLDRLRDAQSPGARHDRLRRQREHATATVRSLLRGDDRDRFDIALRSASVFLPARERTKATAVVLLNEVRMAALELGRRGVIGGHLTTPADLMMLLESELDGYLAAPGGFRDVVAERLRTWHELAELQPPFFVADRVPPLSDWPRRRHREVTRQPLVAGDGLAGASGASGTYRGRVRVIHDLADASALRPGEVMVTPHLDAAWVPLLMVAGAVVSDVGADHSHGVVVCRELGLPCVVSAAGATERLRDGMVVTVDGAARTVTVDAAAEAVLL
jgi:rifampicin phosphotransferase